MCGSMRCAAVLLLLSGAAAFAPKGLALRSSRPRPGLAAARRSRERLLQQQDCRGGPRCLSVATWAVSGAGDENYAPGRGSNAQPSAVSASINSIATLYRRVSWVSWWFQVILSVIGGVILTFANTVRKGGSAYSLWSSGFAFSGIGAISALVNAIWTWNMTRMSRRIARKKIEDSRVIPTLKRLSQVSVTISLLGMLVTLFAAEQIVGTLASKVLSSQGLVPTLAIGTQLNQIQALDIFLVQANTNILVSHYVPLVSFLWLQTQLPSAPLIKTAGPSSAGPDSSSKRAKDL